MSEMSELTYYSATAKIEFEDSKGRPKYRKEQYIVSAISPTDVEAKLNQELKDYDFEIDSIKITKIVKIIN